MIDISSTQPRSAVKRQSIRNEGWGHQYSVELDGDNGGLAPRQDVAISE
jgi:hypothetical protein